MGARNNDAKSEAWPRKCLFYGVSAGRIGLEMGFGRGSGKVQKVMGFWGRKW